jgi:hypothetical protein
MGNKASDESVVTGAGAWKEWKETKEHMATTVGNRNP